MILIPKAIVCVFLNGLSNDDAHVTAPHRIAIS